MARSRATKGHRPEPDRERQRTPIRVDRMLIRLDQFGQALRAAADMTPEELTRQAGSGRSRSYFVRSRGRTFAMKAIIRLAYRQAGLAWDGPQSRQAAAQLRGRFDVVHVVDSLEEERLARQRQAFERWARPGQGRFRTGLLELFDMTCPVSGCSALDAIDACHIGAVADAGSDVLENGWILRADLHRLFDANLMAVDPSSGAVRFAAECRNDFRDFEGGTPRLPAGGPTLAAFAPRWTVFDNRDASVSEGGSVRDGEAAEAADCGELPSRPSGLLT